MKVSYSIHMIKDEFRRDFGFESLEWLTGHGFEVVSENYNKVYTGKIELQDDMYKLLSNLFNELNINQPADYNSRSLSVGDIITIYGKSYFINRFGFDHLENF